MDHAISYNYIPERRRMQGGDGLYNRMSSAHMFREAQDAEFEHKTKKVAEKISEGMNIVANEPSLAFFRIQEHVRKSLPQLVEQKHEVQELQQRVQGASFDTEYATNAVKGLHKSNTHFQNIQDLLKNAMFMKQQIDYEQDRRDQEKVRPSMYGTAKKQSSAPGGRHSLPTTPTTSSPAGRSLNTPIHTMSTAAGRRSRSLPPSKLSSPRIKGTGSPKCIHTSIDEPVMPAPPPNVTAGPSSTYGSINS